MNVIFARRLFFGFLLSFLVAGCTSVAEDYQLDSNESLPANEHLIALEVNLMRESQVDGDLNITASRVKIDNTIRGDLTVAASRLELGENAVIQGDLIYCLVSDGTFKQSPQALIWGEIRNNCQATAKPLDLEPPWILQFFGNLALSIIAGFIAALGSIFLPKHLNRVQLTAYRRWTASLGMGILTVVILIGLSNLWGISLSVIVPIIFLPLLWIIWLAIFSLTVLGGVAVSVPFGTWILKLIRIQKTAPIITAMTGAMTVTFGIMFFRLIDLGLISLILGSAFLIWGLGAALITRGGRL